MTTPTTMLWGLATVINAWMLLVATINRRRAPRLAAARPRTGGLRVSICIPARNEAKRLPALLSSLANVRYAPLEIVVANDRSTDETAAILAAYAKRDPRLTVVEGSPLPAGWLGKTWACAQAARAASGDILIFCDADLVVAPTLVAQTVQTMRQERVAALSLAPDQQLHSVAERVIVPIVMHVLTAAVLPLTWVRWRWRSLTVANGQWLAIERGAYQSAGGHAAVAGEVLDDVALVRRLKGRGNRATFALAPAEAAVRMYTGWPALRDGFGKNLYTLLGGPWLAPAMVALWLVATAVPLAGLVAGEPRWLVPIALGLAMRWQLVRLFRRPLRELAWHPIGAVAFAGLAAASAWMHWRGTVRWKGRRLTAPATTRQTA